MSRINALLTGLATAIGALVGVQAGLAQILPAPIQTWFNEKMQSAIETYLTSECKLAGDWICTTKGCEQPPSRQALIRQDGNMLFFQNERKNDPESAGIWVKPRLVFVPRYDPGHGGDFGDITKDCQKIIWSDHGAVWERKPQ